MSRSSFETSSSGSPGDGAAGRLAANGGARRRHMHVAAQACETCRTRKTRCDERRPRCGLCERLNLICIYREPRPTKRDKTESEILAAVRRIDGKVDRILELGPDILRQEQHSATTQKQSDHLQSKRKGRPPSSSRSSSISYGDADGADGAGGADQRQPYTSYFSESHDLRGALSVFPWPSIQALIRSGGGEPATDLEQVLRRGSAWLVQQGVLSSSHALPPDPLPRSFTLDVATDGDEQSRSVFPDLSAELMELYANAYFGSFNLIYPVLGREDFMKDILPMVKSHGFGMACLKSVIALLVFALGGIAYDGTYGRPIAEGSGIRGGTATTPPALQLFNEARRRVGFGLSSCSLENSQAMLLMAIYFESCSRHTDFWRASVTASDSLRAILRFESHWDDHGLDLIRRTFWVCQVIESWYYLDLNLPRTDIANLEDSIALPDFDHHFDYGGEPNVERKYQYNFLSMVSIRRLIYRIIEELHDPTDMGRKEGEKAHQSLIIGELSRQLSTWRALLPRDLSWDDANRADCHVNTPAAATVNDTNGSNSTAPPLVHVDIALSQLRCRYYYARFMIYRPCVWKALHAPAGSGNAPFTLSPEILEGFVIAIDSMLQWPVAYPPICDKKRLVSNIFVWTQSFLMFLLVLRAVRENESLWHVCEKRLGRGRVEESVRVMLDWLDDMRRVDGAARWAWRTLKPLYGLAD